MPDAYLFECDIDFRFMNSVVLTQRVLFSVARSQFTQVFRLFTKSIQKVARFLIKLHLKNKSI